jgi:DNA-binding Lrp family transcriptional regulator
MAALDVFDWRLLEALQQDASLTNGALAERVGLSASQVSRRRQALEAAGVVRGYRSPSSSMSRSTPIRATMRSVSAIW